MNNTLQEAHEHLNPPGANNNTTTEGSIRDVNTENQDDATNNTTREGQIKNVNIENPDDIVNKTNTDRTGTGN